VKYKQKANSNITFEAFKIQFLENYAKTQLAPKTVERYISLFKRITVAIGHIKLEKLQIGHLADLYSQLGESINQQSVSFIATNAFLEYLIKNHTRVEIAEKTGLSINTIYSLFKKKPIRKECCDKIAKTLKVIFKKSFTNSNIESFLSNKTIKHHHASISAVLNKAVEWQIIKENIAKYIKPPKVEKTDIVFLNEEEVQILINELKTAPHQQGVMIKLFLLTGLRRGELCGLEWKDIENSTINISRASQYIADKGIFTKEPKTKTSIRVLPISKSMKKLLESHRKWQQNMKNEMSEERIETDRLFTTAYGTPIHPDTVTGWFDKFVKKIDIPKVTPHGLRHTFVSLLISKGIDIVTVANLAGHSQTSTTVNMYAHSLQSKKVEAISEISDLIGF
jgi:integrase